MNALSISAQYPKEKFNLLGNTDVMVEIPDIKSPVVQAIHISADPADGEVYVQQKAYRDSRSGEMVPTKYAITKNGLKKLADGAGITMISSEHVVPSTCQKCAAVNANVGKPVQCGTCRNRDVAFRVRISVPQLTGADLIVEDTKEIILENEMATMTDKQQKEFVKHYPQICEAKALNGAIRTALHIKGTYTKEELAKPFVVAYLVPNLNQEDVKRAAVQSMFASSQSLFGRAPETMQVGTQAATARQIGGSTPSVQQIETRAPEDMGAEDGENFDEFIDGTYAQESLPAPTQQGSTEETPGRQMQPQGQPEDDAGAFCDGCGEPISDKVYQFSLKRFGRPLCYRCQKGVGR